MLAAHLEQRCNDVLGAVAHITQRLHALISLRQMLLCTVSKDGGHQQWVRLVAHFEHIGLVDEAKAAECSLQAVGQQTRRSNCRTVLHEIVVFTCFNQ